MKILLITPPMTQLNTPYPATNYLMGFLLQQGYEASQRDMALELFLTLLSPQGLEAIYQAVEQNYETVDDDDLPDSIHYFFSHYPLIRQVLEPCLNFLQGKDPSLAWRIVTRDFLPEGPQFEVLYQMETHHEDMLGQAFGLMGLQDKAKYLATLFINDLAAVIKEGVEPLYEVSRYGERLAASNPSFDDLYSHLNGPQNLVREQIHQLLKRYLDEEQPDALGLTVPFPGNMLAALQIADSCRQLAPNIKIIMGGGYINTELRRLSEPRLFDYVDYITLDDGERPLLTLLEYFQGDRTVDELLRTYRLENGEVTFQNCSQLHDIPHKDIGVPSYAGLTLDRYLSLCEMLNPMHRLWSDGRWNKLTVAHGCYWSKCSFCDISLNYIGHYDEAGADIIIERIKALIAETGQRGFHFVDEAAPPKVLFALAEKLIEQEIIISWWANIRFEKTFTRERCRLLANSGCIAMSGGLEVASDRLLKLMKKGVTVEQVARVTKFFSDAGILVHAYLMYGFPTQTEAETVDALERVRQMMLNGCFQSAYWHRFAATVHSPVGQNPEQYNIELIPNQPGAFAENDIDYLDPVQADHEMLGRGLKKALYNYMHKMGFDYPVSFWFEKEVTEPHISADYIEQILRN